MKTGFLIFLLSFKALAGIDIFSAQDAAQFYSSSTSAPLTQWLVSPTPAGSVRNNFGGAAGYKFTVGAFPITLRSLSRMCYSGNSQTHRVGIYTTNTTPSLLAYVTIDTTLGTPGTLQTVNLATPLVLSASTSYYWMSEEFNGGDNWGEETTPTVTSVATLNGAYYINFGGWPIVNAFPSDGGTMYGPGSFGY